MISIVLPVYNEELVLKENTLKVFDFCRKNLNTDWQIVISDNHSTDTTPVIGKRLAKEYIGIKYYFTHHQGKGYGVLEAWQNYPADIYVFMDVDLATDLDALPTLVNAVKNGADIAVGSRLVHQARTERSLFRTIISRCLRLILKIALNLRVKDAPCGFKAANQKVLTSIVPLVENKTWFFDTEMLWLAERAGFNIVEIPVVWHAPKNLARPSKVSVLTVIREYLQNIRKLYARK